MQLDILMYCSIFYAIEFLEAAKSNQLYKKVRFKKKKDFNACNEKGISLLMWLSTNRNKRMFQLLLKKGELIDHYDHEGKTALYKAAYCAHIETSTFLLDNNASVSRKTNEGRTALLAGAQNGHVDLSALLIVDLMSNRLNQSRK